jgi:predicted phosphodiesterase
LKLKKILFIPDCHIPYHDKKAWALMLRAAKAFKPEILVCLGDFADFYSVSDHDKDPTRERLLMKELEKVRLLRAQLDALKPKKKIFLAGNHEHRLARYMARQADTLHGLVDIQSALGVDASWEYVPYKSHYRLGKLYLTHDADHAGKYALWQTQAAFQHSVGFGHTHGLGVIYTGDATGQPMVAANFGWLGDKKWIDYKKKVKSNRSYITGFGVGYMEPQTKFVHVQLVPIVKGKCLIEGKIIR